MDVTGKPTLRFEHMFAADVGSHVQAEGKYAALTGISIEGDAVVMGFTPETLDMAIQSLLSARARLDYLKAPNGPVLLAPIKSFALATEPGERHPFVSLVFDQRFPSRSGFLLHPKSARDIGKALVRWARKASSATKPPEGDANVPTPQPTD